VQQDHQHPYNDIFKQLLINPGRLNEEQMNQLQALVDRFPQMGLLHALQARYSGDTVHLSRAAAGFADSAVLQKIVLRTSGLPAVNDAQIILKNNDQNTDAVEEAQPQSSEAVTSDVIEAEPVETVSEQENVTTLEPALDVTDVTSEAQPVEEAVAEEQVLEPTPEPEAQPDEPVKENAVEENVTASEPTADPNVAINEEQPIEEAVAIAEEPASETVTELETRLDEPVNNDAVPADLPVAEPTPVTEEDSQLTTDAEVANEGKAEHVAELPVAAPAPLAETQQLIMENIAASNYFVFDTAFIDRNKIVVDETKEEVAEPEPTEPEEASASNTDEGQVTRYHDDKMPYSFLWWLDKTRSKHSATYQPYVINKPAVATVPEKIVPNTEVPEERKKEDEILERFLQEDPQMKPPTGDKLDNENKARHSSEDQDEMITETLARIYADQMLYSKAIAAYKILILKNPEKRRYFANQIEILQKKIN
jgi:hypothetical protein